MRILILLAAALTFTACSQPEETQTQTIAEPQATSMPEQAATNSLAAILAAQPEAVQGALRLPPP